MKTRGNISRCKFDRYVSVKAPDTHKVLIFPFNVKKEEEKNRIYRTNVLVGSAKACECAKCNPDTTTRAE